MCKFEILKTVIVTIMHPSHKWTEPHEIYVRYIYTSNQYLENCKSTLQKQGSCYIDLECRNKVLCARHIFTLCWSLLPIIFYPNMDDKDIHQTRAIISKTKFKWLVDVTLTLKAGVRFFCATHSEAIMVTAAKLF